MAKRISISLDQDQTRLLNNIKGFGKKDAEKVKNLMFAYLIEKGYMEEFNKNG